MTVVDTSDWQRGTVAPQKLIGNFGAASNPETVTLPANAETLWVFCVGVVGMILQSVVGVTTGKPYPFAAMPLLFGAGANPIYVVPVSSAADAQVTITWAAAPAQWYVVADAGVRLVIDQVLQSILATAGLASPGVGLEMLGTDGTNARVVATDTIGRLYIVSTVPSTAAGVHPPYELLIANVNGVSGGSGTIIAAPGVGKRIRLFFISCECRNSGGIMAVGPPGGTYITANNPAIGILDCKPSGIPMAENTALAWGCNVGADVCDATAVYTVEAST